jgi:membrane associated rhomboid family serine protease
VFPLRDDNPTRAFPKATFLIIALNLIVAFFQFRGLFSDPESVENIISTFALIPQRDFIPYSNSISFLAWVAPFFTSMFMHGGFGHLIGNMWSLWIFGDNIEDQMGSFRYIVFYLLSGLLAAITHCLSDPNAAVPVVGASGAIAGVMGAYLFLFPRARIKMFTLLIFYPLFFEIPAVVFIVIWFLGQLLSVTSSFVDGAAGQEVGGIAFYAHIGGFVAGALLLPFFRKRSARRRV